MKREGLSEASQVLGLGLGSATHRVTPRSQVPSSRGTAAGPLCCRERSGNECLQAGRREASAHLSRREGLSSRACVDDSSVL